MFVIKVRACSDARWSIQGAMASDIFHDDNADIDVEVTNESWDSNNRVEITYTIPGNLSICQIRDKMGPGGTILLSDEYVVGIVDTDPLN